jgi:hypothetical protein
MEESTYSQHNYTGNITQISQKYLVNLELYRHLNGQI